MAITINSALFAVRNVAKFGDTDVYPFPLENHWFYDADDEVAELLLKLDRNFDQWLRDYPVRYSTELSRVGYNGFRAATQIDPIWNAYLLALLIEIGEDIERTRIPVESGIVFSYRFKPSGQDNTLFDRDVGWYLFQKSALERAASAEYVVSTDISDFYPRIYHHRLENALKRSTLNDEVARRVMEICSRLSIGGTSFGLPVGGNAARMLAELLLNRTDRLLVASRIPFCRFVDDYYLFASSTDDAQTKLVQLSELLLTNEGLTLARAKTRILSRSEFSRSSPISVTADVGDRDDAMARAFLGFRLAYDPYSPTAEVDYARLKGQLEQFDITGLLARELHKSRIDEGLSRQLVKSIRFLDPELRDSAVLSIMQDLGSLYPIFPSVAIMIHQVLGDLSANTRGEIFNRIRSLVHDRSHILLVSANLSYAVRILAYDRSEEADASLIEVFENPKSTPMVKRDVILAMARKRVDYWLSDHLKRTVAASSLDLRARIAASYTLGDEGKHWRLKVRLELHEADQLFAKWLGEKNSGKVWEIPL